MYDAWFRKSLFGFNCDDVVEYVEKTHKAYTEKEIELKEQIEDLKSYKSSVITEAVTGKVDLREWNKQIVTA